MPVCNSVEDKQDERGERECLPAEEEGEGEEEGTTVAEEEGSNPRVEIPKSRYSN